MVGELRAGILCKPTAHSYTRIRIAIILYNRVLKRV